MGRAGAARLLRVEPTRIVDERERPYMKAIYSPAFEGATRGRRAVGMGRSLLSMNAALSGARRTLLARIRHQLRNHPQLAPAIRKNVGQIVGEMGIMPTSQSPLATERRQHGEAFRAWAARGCDFDGRTNLAGLQAQIVWEVKTNGECFVRLHEGERHRPWSVPLQLQVLGTDMVPEEKSEVLGNGNVIRSGIEFDARGRRVAFHPYRYHPDDPVAGRRRSLETTRVEASEMLHIFDPLSEPGLVRGIPDLARVLLRIADADKYDDAQLDRQLVAAQYVVFFTTATGALPQAFGELAAAQAGTTIDGEAIADGEAIVEPGSQITLGPGEDVKAPPTPSMGDDYETFTDRLDRSIATAIETPVWDYAGRFDRVNFTSGRIGLIPLRTLWGMQIAHMLVPQFCEPLWETWVRVAALDSKIATGRIRRNPERYFAALWRGEGFEWVDPEKEANASRVLVEDGHATTSEILAARGRDFDSTMEEIAAEAETKRRLGITLQTDQGGTGASRTSTAAPTVPIDGTSSDTGSNTDTAATGEDQHAA